MSAVPRPLRYSSEHNNNFWYSMEQWMQSSTDNNDNVGKQDLANKAHANTTGHEIFTSVNYRYMQYVRQPHNRRCGILQWRSNGSKSGVAETSSKFKYVSTIYFQRILFGDYGEKWFLPEKPTPLRWNWWQGLARALRARKILRFGCVQWRFSDIETRSKWILTEMLWAKG